MKGLTFHDAHTSSSVCTPTRYGVLTGRYNWRSRLARGVLGGTSKHLIPANRATVGHLLKKSRIPHPDDWQMAPRLGLGPDR